MARGVFALFFQDGLAVASFEGNEATFEANRDAEGLPWRVCTGTIWSGLITHLNAPSLAVFDAAIYAGELPEPPPSED